MLNTAARKAAWLAIAKRRNRARAAGLAAVKA
jgi:hypothetical protein